MKSLYLRQVSLMLNVIPEVAKEACFALHGGTAINLFVQDMPRLSVDIDLTYLPIQDRNESLSEINHALTRIMGSIKALRPTIKVTHKPDVCKLMVEEGDVLVKIEVNMVSRGVYDFSQFPSVRWKLINLEKFKQSRPDDYLIQLEALRQQLTL